MVVRKAYTSGMKTQHNEVSKYTDVKIKLGISYNIFQFFIIDTFLFISIAPFFENSCSHFFVWCLSLFGIHAFVPFWAKSYELKYLE